MDPPLRFALLGPVQAWHGDRELALGPAKQRAVLAVLLLDPNRPVPVSRIVDAVWADNPPADGTNVVQKYVAGLRRILEPQRPARAPGRTLTLTDAGYLVRLVPGGIDVDVLHARVRAAADARRSGRAEEAAATLHQALAAWRALPLGGLVGPYFDSARARLSARRADAAELWAETSLDLGHYEWLATELPELVAEFPVRERLRAALMLALYRGGRQLESLAVYQEARRYLGEEYGVEPGDELRGLHRRILRNDRDLAAPGSPRPAAPPSSAGAPDPVGKPDAVGKPDPVGNPGPDEPGWPRAGAAWPPDTAPPPRPRTWPLVGGLLSALLCLASFGVATWAVIAVYAASRHSRRLAAAAFGYGALAMTWIAIIPQEIPQEATPYYHLRMLIGIAAILLSAVGGAAQVGYLAFARPEHSRPGRRSGPPTATAGSDH
jgi:DNA-binding SARP family transcriptional activator